jgi:hypothetical protein
MQHIKERIYEMHSFTRARVLKQSVVFQRRALLFHTRYFPGSNRGEETGYSVSDFLRFL